LQPGRWSSPPCRLVRRDAAPYGCDRRGFVRLFVAIGTSGAVYPAAGFVADARASGIRTCEINLEAADNADLFDERRYGPASETVPAWVEALLGR
jgi:NAD-dependent SIR2 family protein deacetylase